MIYIFTIIFFVFGLIIGSFLNVVILRFNTQKSLGGRSGCMACLNKLSWYELIPVFSFLGLGGRCKNCQTKISIQYPLVEFVTGFIFAALFLKFQDIFFSPARNAYGIAVAGGNTLIFILTYVYYAFMFSFLIVIATYDLKHKIIPDTFSVIFGILAFIGLFLFKIDIVLGFPVFSLHLPSIFDLSAGLMISVPFALFYFVSKGVWMGLGDAKLAVGLGWLFGFSCVLSGAVLAFWIGAVVGLCLVIFSKKYGMKSEIPFAPYLVLGMFLVFLFSLNLFSIF